MRLFRTGERTASECATNWQPGSKQEPVSRAGHLVTHDVVSRNVGKWTRIYRASYCWQLQYRDFAETVRPDKGKKVRAELHRPRMLCMHKQAKLTASTRMHRTHDVAGDFSRMFSYLQVVGTSNGRAKL